MSREESAFRCPSTTDTQTRANRLRSPESVVEEVKFRFAFRACGVSIHLQVNGSISPGLKLACPNLQPEKGRLKERATAIRPRSWAVLPGCRQRPDSFRRRNY